MANDEKWSTIQGKELVDMIDQEPEDTTVYEFSNGKRFKRDLDGVIRGDD